MPKTTLLAMLLAGAALFMVQEWRWGQKYEALEHEHTQSVLAGERRAREIQQLRQERSNAIAQAVLADLDAQAATATIIEREVIRYVEDPDRGSRDADPEWVLFHDASARGARPEDLAASGAYDGSVRVTDSDTAEVVQHNYRGCRQEIAKRQRLAQWVEEVCL